MLLTAREDYPDPGKRCVSATFNHQIGFLFQGGVIRESGSSVVLPDGACAGSLVSGSVGLQKGVFLNAGAQEDGERTAGICPGLSADSGPDPMAGEVYVWALAGFGARG